LFTSTPASRPSIAARSCRIDSSPAMHVFKREIRVSLMLVPVAQLK
jgi:hypothetical protein